MAFELAILHPTTPAEPPAYLSTYPDHTQVPSALALLLHNDLGRTSAWLLRVLGPMAAAMPSVLSTAVTSPYQDMRAGMHADLSSVFWSLDQLECEDIVDHSHHADRLG